MSFGYLPPFDTLVSASVEPLYPCVAAMRKCDEFSRFIIAVANDSDRYRCNSISKSASGATLHLQLTPSFSAMPHKATASFVSHYLGSFCPEQSVP